jgi:hypothetical protein
MKFSKLTVCVVAGAGMLVGACANKPPIKEINKAGVTKSEYQSDAQNCRYEAEKATANSLNSGGGLTQAAQVSHTQWRLFAQCMQSRGYTIQWREGCKPSGPYVTMSDLSCY